MAHAFWMDGAPEALEQMNWALSQILPGGLAGFRFGARELLFASPGLAELAGYQPGDPALARSTWYYERIDPEDRAWIGAEAARQLEGRSRAEMVYRLRRPDGTVKWVKQYAGVVQGAEPYFLCLIVDYTETRQAQQRAERAGTQIENVINAIPGGVARIAVDGELELLLASDGFYRLTGYSREECAHPPISDDPLYFVLPEDHERIRQAVRGLVERKTPINIEYRIRRKDGSVNWNSAHCARAVEVDGRIVVDAVFTDITETKRLERAVALDAERYRIVSQQSQEIIFDWDLESDVIEHSPAIREKLGCDFPLRLSSRELLEMESIFGADRAVVERLFQGVRRGEPSQEAEYRLCRPGGGCLWVRNRVTTLFGDQGRPVRAVGTLTDIDSYKRENAQLQKKAERDLLTGLLNRGTLEERVRARLKRPAAGRISAFYLIDVDDFKDINDQLGHDRGDRMLSEVARRIQSQFREEDPVGRMGGDEFAAFVGELPSRQAAEERAERLSRLLRRDVDGAPVTASVGLALCPDHGVSFESLYRHADVALYTSKRRGRSRWSIYEPPERR